MINYKKNTWNSYLFNVFLHIKFRGKNSRYHTMSGFSLNCSYFLWSKRKIGVNILWVDKLFFRIGTNGKIVCVFLSRIQLLFWENYFLKKWMQVCFYMSIPTCFRDSVSLKMQLVSPRQGYFLAVSQLPLPWVMALCDSLSDSDEVMSEPRTKLSLLCPTKTLSLLAFYAIGLFLS